MSVLLFLHALPFAKIALDYIAPLALFGGLVGLVMLSLGILPGWGAGRRSPLLVPTLDEPADFDALLPDEQRWYLDGLAEMKWKKRQKGGKKVNKRGLLTLLLVVGSEVLAISRGVMLAQSAPSGGVRSNLTAHSAADANTTTLYEPETEVSRGLGFLLHNNIHYLTRPPPPTSSCSLALSSSFRWILP